MAVRPPDSFLIWGGGGHGKVIADLLRTLGHMVVGYVDRDSAKLHQEVEPGGAWVILSEEALLASVRARGSLPENVDALALAIGNNRLRQRCLEGLAGMKLPALIHPSATVSSSARFGEGAAVLAGAVVNASVRIGRVVIVNSGVIVEHDCVLEDAVHVSPGATLTGGVRAGERSWIGAGAVLLPGIRVGSDAIVGAGAVVIRDVPNGVTVVGNPGRILSTHQT